MSDRDRLMKELLDGYEGIAIINVNAESTEISGEIHIHRSIKQYVSCGTYSLSVFVPSDQKKLPYVIDHGGIDAEYPHRYPDGKLCLATDIDMVVAFDQDPSLVTWMRNFVEPYYATYEYYRRYGEFPEGDRAHDVDGIVQSYMDLFSTDGRQAVSLLDMIVNDTYRGHHPCPCGSGRRIRNCHGNMILKFKNSSMLLEQAKKDYQMMYMRFVREYAKQQRNSGITK